METLANFSYLLGMEFINTTKGFILVTVVLETIVADAISKIYLDTILSKRDDVNHCSDNKEEKYTCWLGPTMTSRQQEFYKMLNLRASPGKLVILSYVDFAYVEMAVNLHESFRALQIKNFLFICADEKALKILRRRGIASVLYHHPEINSDEAPQFYSGAFCIKTSIKIKIITAAIMHGFQVLFTDVDVVFLRDPIPYLDSNKRADLLIQKDSDYDLNSGFLLVRPTYFGVTLMLRTLDIVMQWIIVDQVALNLVIEEMLAAKILDVVILDPQKFPNGKVYFEDKRRMFLEDRKQKDVAYVVHNNCLQTKVGICTCDNYLSVFTKKSE